VVELLDLVGLGAFRDRNPDQLSGGQKQRVALARVLAQETDVLLLDEPFSNLDVRLRERMREEVRRIIKDAGVTAVSVTHDQEEALSISDRVAVMNDGRLEQVGRPESVFEHPESRFVAEFLGQAGFVSGRFEDGSVATGIGRFTESMLEGLSDEYEGAAVDVLVRPDDLRAVPAEGV
ncbi:ABC transporter ATP-binding protein, partial [Halobium palmae]